METISDCIQYWTAFYGGAMISGIAGASHIILGAGIVLFFIMLLQAVGKKQSHKNQAV